MPLLDAEQMHDDFVKQVSPETAFYLLFDHFPGVSFFAKNRQFQLMCASRSFLERLGCRSESDIIGKTDFELFPKSLAEHFRKDDEWVLNHKKPKLQIVELFINTDGLPDWYLTNKLPVLDKDGQVIGVMGTTQNYQHGKQFIAPYLQIEPAIDFIRENFREKISIVEIAAKVKLSTRQLDRRFQETLKMSPQEFLMKLRLKTACSELHGTSKPMMEIAIGLGFYDQSSFTLHFKKHMGQTPLQYRKRHQESPSTDVLHSAVG